MRRWQANWPGLPAGLGRRRRGSAADGWIGGAAAGVVAAQIRRLAAGSPAIGATRRGRAAVVAARLALVSAGGARVLRGAGIRDAAQAARAGGGTIEVRAGRRIVGRATGLSDAAAAGADPRGGSGDVANRLDRGRAAVEVVAIGTSGDANRAVGRRRASASHATAAIALIAAAARRSRRGRARGTGLSAHDTEVRAVAERAGGRALAARAAGLPCTTAWNAGTRRAATTAASPRARIAARSPNRRGRTAGLPGCPAGLADVAATAGAAVVQALSSRIAANTVRATRTADLSTGRAHGIGVARRAGRAGEIETGTRGAAGERPGRATRFACVAASATAALAATIIVSAARRAR
jgi:hypothetical protein